MARGKRKTARSYGNHLTKDLRVRLAPETDGALRKAKQLFSIPISEFVRAGVEDVLARSVPMVVARIDDPKTSDSMKMKLAEYLRACAYSDIAIHQPELAKQLREGH